MQIVIKISDELYKRTVKKNSKDCATFTQRVFVEIIQNGIPLPKGHGDLIDADELKKKAIEIDDMYMLHEIDEAPTIIEADKEGENGD